MASAPPFFAADATTKQFPNAVRQRQADNFRDRSAPEGAVLVPFAERDLLKSHTVFLGDSITIGGTGTSGSGIQNQGPAWPTFMVMASQGRMRLTRNAGVGGNTSAQMLARFDTDVAAFAPEVVVLVAGTNDIGQGLSITSWQANMIALVAKVRSIEAVPILGTIYPNSESTARTATGEVWNAWLREYCRTQRIRLIPFDRLADPATGGWPTAWLGTDKTHPVAGGAIGAIGQFAWQSVADYFGAPVVQGSSYNGADAFANGFLTTLGAALAAPTPAAATSTSSGSLAAGTYSYKVSTVSVAGETIPSAPASATLSAAGTVTITWGNVANRGYRVYRKGPADSDWYLLGFLAPNATSFTDNGSMAPTVQTPEAVDRSAVPADLSTGFNNAPVPGTGVRTDPAVRGNVFRFGPQNDGSQNLMYVGPGVTVAPGEVWEFTCKCRALTNLLHSVQINLTGTAAGGRVNPADSLVAAHDWQLISQRFTVPAGYTTAQAYILTLGLVDFAEFGFRKIPTIL